MDEGVAESYGAVRTAATVVVLGAVAASLGTRAWMMGVGAVLVLALLPVVLVAAGVGTGRHSLDQIEQAYRTRRWLRRVIAPLTGVGAVTAAAVSLLGANGSWRPAIALGAAVVAAVAASVWLQTRYPKAGADYR